MTSPLASTLKYLLYYCMKEPLSELNL